jgi:hypothetical protein
VKLFNFTHSFVFSVGQDGAVLCVISRVDTHVCHPCFCLAAALFHLHFLQRTRISKSFTLMIDYSAPWNEAIKREGNCWLEAKSLEKRDNLFHRYSKGIDHDI